MCLRHSRETLQLCGFQVQNHPAVPLFQGNQSIYHVGDTPHVWLWDNAAFRAYLQTDFSVVTCEQPKAYGQYNRMTHFSISKAPMPSLTNKHSLGSNSTS